MDLKVRWEKKCHQIPTFNPQSVIGLFYAPMTDLVLYMAQSMPKVTQQQALNH